jgi:hypothetical protein
MYRLCGDQRCTSMARVSGPSSGPDSSNRANRRPNIPSRAISAGRLDVSTPTRPRHTAPFRLRPHQPAPPEEPRRAPDLPAPLPKDGLLPDLALYEHLIRDGLLTATARGAAVDHITARRLAIWIAARPQPVPFARALTAFAQTGAITRDLHNHLRAHARSAAYPHRSQAAWLLDYCIARGTDTNPLGPDFAAACDQLDRADLMLTELHDRNRHNIKPSEPGWPDTPAPAIIALASRDPETGTFTFVLDADTASIALYAVAAHADDREAHIREIQRYAATLPDNTYGKQNRQHIAARETRIATRLRAIEHAYRTATERHTQPTPPETHLAHERASGREIELE